MEEKNNPLNPPVNPLDKSAVPPEKAKSPMSDSINLATPPNLDFLKTPGNPQNNTDTAKIKLEGLLGSSQKSDFQPEKKPDSPFGSMSDLKSEPKVETNPPISPGNEGTKKIMLPLIIALSAVIAALASGAGVYFWQSSQVQTAQDQAAALQTQIATLNNKIATLEKEALARKEAQELASKTVEPQAPSTVPEGWTKYVFNEVDNYHTKPFEVMYPSYCVLKDAATAPNIGFPVNKLLTFAAAGKDCWMNILQPPTGIEGQTPAPIAEEKEVLIGNAPWTNSIWKQGDKTIYYDFSLENKVYVFSVSPENLDQCLEMYKSILATFRFTK